MIELKKTGMKLISYTCMIAMVLISGCSGEDDPALEAYKSGEEAIATFRCYFYNAEGVNAFKQDDFLETEWGVPIDQAEKACILFHRITGMNVKLTEKYNYSYQSTDGKCALRIEGQKTPVNAVYATIYVNIPECPDIHTVLLVTPEYFDNTNEWPVKW